MTESQEKPLATWLMENIVKGDVSEFLDFEEINLADCTKDDRFVCSFCNYRHRDE
jgi:hypothetical protein